MERTGALYELGPFRGGRQEYLVKTLFEGTIDCVIHSGRYPGQGEVAN